MALAVDATSADGVQSSTTNWTWSHTCSGTERILVVAFISNGVAATACTYNSVALTKAHEANAAGVCAQVWYLINPASGTNTILFTNGAAYGEGSAVSFTGADQATQPDATAAETGSSATTNVLNITTVAADTYIVDCIAVIDTFITSGPTKAAAQTLIDATNATFMNGGSSYKAQAAAGASTSTWTWTLSFSSAAYAHVGMSIKPAAAAGAIPHKIYKYMQAVKRSNFY